MNQITAGQRSKIVPEGGDIWVEAIVAGILLFSVPSIYSDFLIQSRLKVDMLPPQYTVLRASVPRKGRAEQADTYALAVDNGADITARTVTAWEKRMK